jgi:nucleoid-associated protein YgaU
MRLLLVLVTLLIAACGRFAPGFIVTEDGRTIANSDENNRQLVVDNIRTQLDQQLGGHWRTAVSLPELPTYSEGGFDARSDNDGWQWSKATLTVELVGDGTVPLPMKEEALRTVVTDYMKRKVYRPGTNLTVTVSSTTDATRFANLGLAAHASAATANPSVNNSGANQRRYVVQAGDTLADISAAFYGSAQHWRLIRDANPGLDAGELKAGMPLVIPPKP